MNEEAAESAFLSSVDMPAVSLNTFADARSARPT